MFQKYPIILSSGSPRRKELLETSGLIFATHPTDADESIDVTIPQDVVTELAHRKAYASYEDIFKDHPEYLNEINDSMIVTDHSASLLDSDLSSPNAYIIIGSDTVVAMDDQILGKPHTNENALKMLNTLSGHMHTVYTGLCFMVVSRDGTIMDQYSSYEKSDVYMRDFSEKEAIDYVKSGEPLDKAGAYGIQGIGTRLITHINGDYNTIVGFPISRLIRELMNKELVSF